MPDLRVSQEAVGLRNSASSHAQELRELHQRKLHFPLALLRVRRKDKDEGDRR